MGELGRRSAQGVRVVLIKFAINNSYDCFGTALAITPELNEKRTDATMRLSVKKVA